MGMVSRRWIEALFPSVPTPWRRAFDEYQRVLARRVVVVAACAVLLILPGLQLLEYWLDAPAPGLWEAHALLRAPLALAALAVLWLRVGRPDGRWPRGAVLVMAVGFAAVGWGILALHLLHDAPGVHVTSHNLTIAMTAVAVMATRGARDLLLVYLPPLLLALSMIALRGAGLVHDVVHLLYPAIAMVVGVVIAELLYRGHVQAFVATQRLEQSAMTDTLTGLLNRRAMFDVLRAGHARAVRHRGAYAVVMADLDFFKRVNDTHGHDVGDQVLRELGVRLRDSVRAEDAVARWGGEEFLVLLQDADEDVAMRVAEKIRDRVGAQAFDTTAGRLAVTISLGVAVSRGEDSHEHATSRADEALYLAKRGGRNRSVLAGAAQIA